MKICVDTFGVTIKVKEENGDIWDGVSVEPDLRKT